VNYTELIPLLVSKINAMQIEIDELKNQNNNI
jgi:FtsZ-binding cell division protein ZapB